MGAGGGWVGVVVDVCEVSCSGWYEWVYVVYVGRLPFCVTFCYLLISLSLVNAVVSRHDAFSPGCGFILLGTGFVQWELEVVAHS